jgi:hypothetical protein
LCKKTRSVSTTTQISNLRHDYYGRNAPVFDALHPFLDI